MASKYVPQFLRPAAETVDERKARLESERDERMESERRWYAGLPTKVLITFTAVVAILTGLLSVAPYAPPRPAAKIEPPIPAAPAASQPPAVKPAAQAPVSLEGKKRFGFNSSRLQIQSGDRAAVDLHECVAPSNLTGVRVTGHTDCIGSDAFNERLSFRRAQAVGNYLVQQEGVPSRLVAVEGVGSNEARSDPACSGRLTRSAELIRSLEKYRRVDVVCTVSGA